MSDATLVLRDPGHDGGSAGRELAALLCASALTGLLLAPPSESDEKGLVSLLRVPPAATEEVLVGGFGNLLVCTFAGLLGPCGCLCVRLLSGFTALPDGGEGFIAFSTLLLLSFSDRRPNKGSLLRKGFRSLPWHLFFSFSFSLSPSSLESMSENSKMLKSGAFLIVLYFQESESHTVLSAESCGGSEATESADELSAPSVTSSPPGGSAAAAKYLRGNLRFSYTTSSFSVLGAKVRFS